MDSAAQARTLPELVRSKFSVPRFSALTHQIDDEKERSGVVDLDSPIYAKAFDLKRTAFRLRARKGNGVAARKGLPVIGARTAEGRER